MALVNAGCDRTYRATESIIGQTMGTTYSIKYIPGVDSPELKEIGKVVNEELLKVNQQMSTYIDDSEISQFNASSSTDWFEVSADTAKVVHLALSIHHLSNGAFDITVAPLVNLWGFGPTPEPDEMPSDAVIDELLQFVGSEKLQVRLEPPALKKQIAGMKIDLSAIAKGHGVDRVAHKLDLAGVNNYFVEIGGEIRTKGTRLDGLPWQVGIERPDPEKRALHQVVGLSNGSMATSGDYRNFLELSGKRVTHFIDPKSGRPVASELVSASVIADDCATADAIATALMASGTLNNAIELTERYKWATLLIAKHEDKLETVSSVAFENRLAKTPRSATGK
jgi:FAD:protein FMN transferase